MKIQNNQALYYGGGIYHSSILGKLSLMNSEVSNNQATDASSGGGGIYSVGQLILETVTVDSNSAGYEAGGIALYGSDSLLDMSYTYVTNNSVTAAGGEGGGIASALGSATIYGSTISGNTATGAGGAGGGISTNTSMNLQYSEVSGNTADDIGGGIMHWYGDLNVTHTAVRANTILDASGAGAGIYASLGTLELSAVEVSGNSAPYAGGGVDSGASATITNTTISGNSAQFGGGLLISSAVSSSLLNSTITANFEPTGTGVGGIYAASPLTIQNTIIAGNEQDECWDISGPNITSLGNNIEDTNTCGFSASGDQPNTDPLLGLLADNGGETQTHLPGAPAIDAGNNPACPATDQRDVIRPIDGDLSGPALCDVGAVEVRLKLYLPLIVR